VGDVDSVCRQAEHRRGQVLIDRNPLDDLAAVADARDERVFGSWVQMQPSASRQMPSGLMPSAHTRRCASPPSRNSGEPYGRVVAFRDLAEQMGPSRAARPLTRDCP